MVYPGNPIQLFMVDAACGVHASPGYFATRSRKIPDSPVLFINRHLIGFAIYTLVFWGLGFLLCSLCGQFDGRDLNLFNTIKNDTFLLNLLMYSIPVFIARAWMGAEQHAETSKEMNLLKKFINEINSERLHAEKQIRPEPDTTPTLTVKNGVRTILIPFTQIICLLARGAYIKISTDTGSYMMNGRLHDVQTQLPPQFIRVHRSHIVNGGCIKEARSLPSGDCILLLKNGAEIRASRTYRAVLRAVFKR